MNLLLATHPVCISAKISVIFDEIFHPAQDKLLRCLEIRGGHGIDFDILRCRDGLDQLDHIVIGRIVGHNRIEKPLDPPFDKGIAEIGHVGHGEKILLAQPVIQNTEIIFRFRQIEGRLIHRSTVIPIQQAAGSD